MGSNFNGEFGVMINGEFLSIPGMNKIVDAMSNAILKDVMHKVEIELRSGKLGISKTTEINYTVAQVADMTNRAVSTITCHCRVGLLKASKVGKSWLISEENYLAYKNNA